MKEYFSAAEAREMTKAVNDGIMDKELKYIYEEIRKAISSGLRSIKFRDTTFSKATVNFLRNNGFVVEHFTGVQWDPANDTSISWQ